MDNLENLRASLDDFSLKLYGVIASQSSHDNIFLSPLSISSALLLVYVGANNETKKEIEHALQLSKSFGGEREDVLAAYQEVLRVFVPGKDEDSGEASYQLALANKAYVRQDLTLKPQFEQTIISQLNSEVGKVDFQGNTEGVRQEINQWVEKQTNNKIKDLLASGSIDAHTLMVLVNAIYFKADWLDKFSESDTKKEKFATAGGGESDVDMMYITKKIHYYDNFEDQEQAGKVPRFQVAVIPYKQREMSMLVLLPENKNGLADLERHFDMQTLKHLYQNTANRKVHLRLPRFKLEQSYDLVDVLQKMGIQTLFASADLSGIADGGLSVSGAVHKAFVEVNEKGTEAAAATAIMMTRMMVIEREPVEFRADHPFLFAIRHEPTRLITFMGRVAKP
ncbi:hypothetical protein RvY_01056 [Ramazzottius varieornatus]|uniref:Serpin domain-containing protein n=1 Tax=Ramazzottius varieornatus TaxID=947166 RepID=A0A1D1UL25_RAMVA|nr:hypothetical protein RvY_01056 [Ramazzottius varieornatus]